MQATSTDNKTLIAGIVAVTVLIFGGLASAIYFAPSDSVTTLDEQVTFNDVQSPSVGPVDAKVVVRMYSDFQCPACRSAEAGVKVAMDRYKDRVRFVWKDFPLMSIHRNARPAANAARCAEDQNMFWEYRTKLYDAQTSWEGVSNPKNLFTQYAGELSLNLETFGSCLDASANDGKVMSNVTEGNQNRVDSTPTVFINNRRYQGMTPTAWVSVLDQLLAEADASAPASASSTN